MNFSNKWLNWKVVGGIVIGTLSILFTGWILYQIDLRKRTDKLQTEFRKYGGIVYEEAFGIAVGNWLLKSKLAVDSRREGEIVIIGTKFDVHSFLSTPYKVSISGSPALDDEHYELIAAIGTIRHLELPLSTIGDPQVKIISRCRGLEYLELSGVSLSDVGFSHLENLPHLRGFTFSNSVLSDQSCEVLLELKRLTHLEILHTSFTSEGIRRLGESHPSLEEIYITRGVLSPEELELLNEINPKIEVITIFSGDSFRVLKGSAIFRSQK